MSALTSWVGSGAGLVLIGTAWVVMHHRNKHASRLPAKFHPLLSRLEIFAFYAGGCVLAGTALGGYFTRIIRWVLALGGSAGLAHVIIVLAGVALFVAVLLDFLFDPGDKVAWLALALPFVAALTGGKLHGILTVVPGAQIASGVMHWIGG